MSDALPLPPRPDLGQYRKLAKDLQRACRSGDQDAVRGWAARWVGSLAPLEGLERATAVRRAEGLAREIAERWRRFSVGNRHASRCALAAAQLFTARESGFASWPRVARPIPAPEQAASTVPPFGAAGGAAGGGRAL